MRPIIIPLGILLILIPSIVATHSSPLSEYLTCYNQQGIQPEFRSSNVPVENAEEYCKEKINSGESTNLNVNDCLESLRPNTDFVFIWPGKNLCADAPDPQACTECVSDIQFKVQLKEIFGKTILYFTLIMIPLSSLYLLFEGIYYLIKRKLLGPRWLMIVMVISLVISILLFVYIIYLAFTYL